MTMFRLYLMNRLEGMNKKKTYQPKKSKGSLERRKHERFSMEEKNIPLSSEDDILLIKDLSEEGMSLKANERAFNRLEIGDLYQCNIRYLSEKIPCTVEVRWKKGLSVGLQIKNPEPSLKTFIQRLLIPQKLGRSLKKVTEKKALQDIKQEIEWYMGIKETHVVFKKEKELTFWLIKTQKYILYYNEKKILANIEEGEFNTQMINRFLNNSSDLELIPAEESHLILAKDILAASSIKEKD